MSNYYVRIKGRIQGPFPVDKLQGMAKRGQLSRIHQVSEDREVWRKAAEYPELFAAPEGRSPSQKQRASSKVEDEKKVPNEAIPGSSSALEANWYVEHDGKPHGPMSFADLKGLFNSESYDSASLVWRDGMQDWVSAESVDGLISVTALLGKIAVQKDVTAESKNSLDEQTMGILRDSRGWIILCAVILIVWSILWSIGAFVIFVQGIKLDSSAIVVSAIVGFGFALVVGLFAMMTFSYASSILRIQIHRDVTSLNSSLKKLSRIWVCFGCLLLLSVLLLLISFILQLIETPVIPNYF